MDTTDPLINPCVEELEVARILVEFSQFVFEPRSITWGRKRKRSDIARYDDQSPTATVAAKEEAAEDVEPSPSPFSALGPSEETVKLEGFNLSPATPLSFSPSESDEKEKPKLPRRKKVSIKKRREELLKNLEELTQSKQSLMLEITNAKLLYDKLKQDNMKLKQYVVGNGKRAENPLEMETCKGLVNGQSQVNDEAIPTTVYERPMTAETAMVSQASFGLCRGYDKAGPIDLNVSAEEAVAEGKARAAEARLRRRLKMKKCRSTSPNSSCKHRIIS